MLQETPTAPQQVAVPSTENQETQQTIPDLGNISVETLRTFLTHLEGGNNVIAGVAPSPFSQDVRRSTLPPSFRGVGDLRFTEITNTAEYLGRFNTEMELYQMEDLTKCRLLASTLRGNAHQWFQMLGSASIGMWEQVQKMFLTQFQSSIHYAPHVTTLANIRQRKDETLQSYFKRFNSKVPMVRGATDETIKNFLIARVRVGSDFQKELQ